jgi:hypothetical protein
MNTQPGYAGQGGLTRPTNVDFSAAGSGEHTLIREERVGSPRRGRLEEGIFFDA